MSADSNSSPFSDPLPIPPGTEQPSETLPRKRRYKKPEASAASPSDGDTDSEIIVLSSMLQNLLARKQGNEGGEAEGEVRNKINRFVPRGTPASSGAGFAQTPEAPAADPAASSAPGVPARQSPNGPDAMAAIAFPKFEPRAFQTDPDAGWGLRSGSTWGRGILYFAFTAALALAAFLVGRNDVHRGDAAPKPAPAPTLAFWSASDTEKIDHALTADRAGDLATARKLTDDLTKSMGPNPLLAAYSATIDTRLGRTNDVEADLARAIGPNTPPEAAAVLGEVQGFNYTRRREFDHAVDAFTSVARIDPFNVANLQNLAECQRREGRLADAINTFGLAARRLVGGSPTDEGVRAYLAYKQRLTQVEGGRDADFQAELARRLAEPVPAPYWLLTDAAVALQKNALPAAVAALQKARAALSAEDFATLMDDYFFRSYAHLSQIAPFLPAATPERQQARNVSMEYFIDP